jgi:hypothetical protein
MAQSQTQKPTTATAQLICYTLASLHFVEAFANNFLMNIDVQTGSFSFSAHLEKVSLHWLSFCLR